MKQLPDWLHMLIARAKGQQVGALMDAPLCPACKSADVTTYMEPADLSKLPPQARSGPSMWVCPKWDAYLAARAAFYAGDYPMAIRNGGAPPEPPAGHVGMQWALAGDAHTICRWVAGPEGNSDGRTGQ